MGLVACSREQRSSPVAVWQRHGAVVRICNGRQALGKRRWSREAYQVAITSEMLWRSGLKHQALCVPSWLVRFDSKPCPTRRRRAPGWSLQTDDRLLDGKLGLVPEAVDAHRAYAVVVMEGTRLLNPYKGCRSLHCAPRYVSRRRVNDGPRCPGLFPNSTAARVYVVARSVI